MATPQWFIQARSNSTLLLVDTSIEQDFEALTLQKKFNEVGTWALKIRKESPHLATFLPAYVSGRPGFPNGILVYVDNGDGNGRQLVMSGPQLDIDVKVQNDQTQAVVITGASDEYWLSKRQAFQVPHFPYIYFCTGTIVYTPPPASIESNWYTITPFNGKRFYTFGEASGGTATDIEGLGNGTYTGTLTYGQPGLIDFPATCVNFGGTGYVNAGTASIPSGNAAWTYYCWVMISATPGANINAFAGGTSPAASKSTFTLYVDTAGKPHIEMSGVNDVAGATALSNNVPHLLAMSYDGSSTVTGYLDGASFGTFAASALTIGTTAFTFGAFNDATGKWTGKMGMAGIYGGAISAANMALMYTIGLSRHTYLAYDTIPSLNASTQIIYYVQRNAAATGTLANYGTAQPSSAFTNWQTSHGARTVPMLTMAADPVAGSSLTGIARMDNLLDLIASLALMSTTELGFKLEQSGSNLVFTVYAPTDLTATAIFSRDLYGATGNILDYHYKIAAPSANHLIVGGSNPAGGSANLVDRLFQEGEDANSISAEAYLEAFLDYRQGSSSTTLGQAITNELGKGVAQIAIDFTSIDIPGVLYFKGPSGKGYDLGNKVTFSQDGQLLQNLIRSVQVDLQPGQPAIITPVIGTPNYAAVQSIWNTINTRLQSLGLATIQLKTNY